MIGARHHDSTCRYQLIRQGISESTNNHYYYFNLKLHHCVNITQKTSLLSGQIFYF